MSGTGRRCGLPGGPIPQQRRVAGVSVPWPPPDVERSTTMQETVTGEAVDAILSYSASDPHAVWIFFDLGADNPLVGWAFGRDLLNEGLHALAGGEVGEIMIEPDTRSDIVVLYLRSPDGTVVLEADTNDIVAFLNSTARKVPVGTESAIAEGLVIEAVERVLSV